MTDRPDVDGGETATPSSHNLVDVARGGGLLAAGDLYNYAARFVGALILARALGADDYGLYVLAVSLIFLAAGLGNLGLDAAMERYVAVLRRRGDDAAVWGTLQIGLGFGIIGALLVSTVMFFSADLVSDALFNDARLARLLRIGALIVPFLIATSLLASVLRGFKRMGQSALTEDFIQPTIRVGLIAIWAITGLNATIALIIFGVSYAAAAVVLFGLVHRLHPLNRPVREGDRHGKEIASFSFPFWLSGVLNQIRKNVQPVLLGLFNTVTNVGIFSLVSSANLLGRTAAMATRTSLRPTLAETLDEGDEEQTLHLYQATTRWVFTANMPAFLIMVLYPVAILSLFGKSFEAGASALVIVVFAELISSATGTAGTLIDMSGLNLMKTINKLFDVAFTLVVNIWFIVNWGLIGAALAVLLSRTVVQLVRVIEVRIVLGLHPYNWRILKPVLAGLVAFSAGKGMDYLLPADASVLNLIVDVAVVGVVYVAVLLILGVSEEDRVVAGELTKRLPGRRARSRQ